MSFDILFNSEESNYITLITFKNSFIMKQNLINFFAIIGVISFILLACSVDSIDESSDNNDNNNNTDVITSNNGKYQVSYAVGGLTALNTETGKMKYYTYYNDNWVEVTQAEITFTH